MQSILCVVPVDQGRRRAPQVLLAIASILAVLTACGGKPAASAQPGSSPAASDTGTPSPTVTVRCRALLIAAAVVSATGSVAVGVEEGGRGHRGE